MEYQELHNFIQAQYVDKTARKTLHEAIWLLYNKFNAGMLIIKCIDDPIELTLPSYLRVYQGTDGKITKKRFLGVKEFSLVKENDILIIRDGRNKTEVFVFYEDKKVPPL